MTNYTTGRAKLEAVKYTPEQKTGLLMIFLICVIIAVFIFGMTVGACLNQGKEETARDAIRDLHYIEHCEVMK